MSEQDPNRQGPDRNQPTNPFAAPRSRAVSSTQRLELATLGQRLGGFLFDQLIPMAALLLVLLATGDLGNYVDWIRQLEQTDPMRLPISETSMNGVGVVLVVLAVVQVTLMYKSSQTLGKRIVGSRVHRMSGERATGTRILLLRGLVPALLYVIPGVGMVAMFLGHLLIFGAQRRCLHDYVADTQVLQA